jgi:antitoxin MazE
METTVANWGNSLGVRIPKVFSEEAGISQGSKVDITFKDGRLIIEPVKEEEKSLKELLSTVTKNNLHGEVETDVQGEEVW